MSGAALNVTLYNSDCMEILRNMPDASVDHIITDPPYGERTHKGARTGGNGHSDPNSGKAVLVDFNSITDEQFIDFCREAVRVSRRWVLLTCEWRHAARLEESGLPLVRLGVWHKPNGAPQFTGDRPGTGWEAVAILHREGKKRWNGGGHHAVWTVNKTEGQHPAQKPLPLIRQWMKQFTDKGETVMDPFMGSGTTGVVCMETDRNFIGCEIDKGYFDIAAQRIESAQQQLKLAL